MLIRFPLDSAVEYGPWIEKFKGAQNPSEARAVLLLEWRQCKTIEVKRICERISRVWSPVGVREDDELVAGGAFNLVMHPLRALGRESYFIEISGDPRNPHDYPKDVIGDFFLHFSNMKTYDGSIFCDIGDEPEGSRKPEGEWIGSRVLCRLPTGDPLLISPKGRVGRFYYSGHFADVFAENLEQALFRFFDTIDPM